MTRVVWDSASDRFYELGVDRGVLYVDGVGVPWNGLVSVDEAPSGGESRPYYQDGLKYMIRSSPEEYAASLSAFFSPPEFDKCDGTLDYVPGVRVTNQRRKPFGLTYRTRIGSDTGGPSYGHKIHIVYNATAQPSNRSYRTLGAEVEPVTLSWDISTRPAIFPGKRPTAHLVIDTTAVDPQGLAAIEDILYGSEDNMPRLITPEEIVEIFVHPFDFTVTANPDGTYLLSGPADSIEMVDANTYEITRDTVVILDADTAQISSDA